MIRRLFIMVCMTLLPAFAANADLESLYTIRDIEVSETAGNVIEAQRQALAVARLIASHRMIERITSPEERERVGGIFVDDALAQAMAAAVDVQKETRGGGRYVATLSVVMKPPVVRNHLRSLGVNYVDTQAPAGLLVPLADGALVGPWQLAWGERNDGALAPYITAISPYGRDLVWSDIQGEVGTSGAFRGLIAELGGSAGAYSVRLSSLTASGRTEIGTTGRQPSLEGAVMAASALLDRVWMGQAAIDRNGARTISEATVRYTSLPEWNTLRSALPQSPLVSDFQIKAVSSDGAVIQFAYAGDAERLISDLRQRGVAFEATEQGWVMTSAVTGVQ